MCAVADEPVKALKDYAYTDEYGGGWSSTPEGCHWDTAREMLLCSDDFIGFCGCGIDGDFEYVLGGLRLINRRFDNDHDNLDAWWKQHREAELKHFGHALSAQFFYKWADKAGLAEHGGSVPGWLTEKGKTLLRLMEEAFVLEPREEEPDHA